MAIIFDMWAECDTAEECERLAAHFDGLKTNLLSTGRTITWFAGQLPLNPAAMTVSSADMSQYGIRTLQDVLECTESGLYLYHHLKDAPPFKFARVALDAENIPSNDLAEFTFKALEETFIKVSCVMNERLFRSLGSPNGCQQFRDGYFWSPYRGESYEPLFSMDQAPLNELCLRLFPQYFSR